MDHGCFFTSPTGSPIGQNVLNWYVNKLVSIMFVFPCGRTHFHIGNAIQSLTDGFMKGSNGRKRQTWMQTMHVFKIFEKWVCRCFIRKKMHSFFFGLPDEPDLFLVRNSECKSYFVWCCT